jgi:hypothetical protein
MAFRPGRRAAALPPGADLTSHIRMAASGPRTHSHRRQRGLGRRRRIIQAPANCLARAPAAIHRGLARTGKHTRDQARPDRRSRPASRNSRPR